MLYLAANPAVALAYFLGSWTCRRGGAHPRTMKTQVAWSIGHTWLRADTSSPTSIAPGRPFIGTQYLTYSPVSKRFVSMNLNNFGGYWIAESNGWNRNRLVWIDQSTEDGERGITTIRRLSANSYRVHEDLTLRGQPEPSPADVLCTRKNTT